MTAPLLSSWWYRVAMRKPKLRSHARLHRHIYRGEVWYLRHYDAANLTQFTGDAVMLGPTLYVQFTPKMFMTAAWNTQVWGREVGNPVSLNLAEFQRNRAKLKFAWEF